MKRQMMSAVSLGVVACLSGSAPALGKIGDIPIPTDGLAAHVEAMTDASLSCHADDLDAEPISRICANFPFWFSPRTRGSSTARRVSSATACPIRKRPDNAGSVGFYVRNGPHDVATSDWNNMIDFAEAYNWGR